jgi:hypothetical protein
MRNNRKKNRPPCSSTKMCLTSRKKPKVNIILFSRSPSGQRIRINLQIFKGRRRRPSQRQTITLRFHPVQLKSTQQKIQKKSRTCLRESLRKEGRRTQGTQISHCQWTLIIYYHHYTQLTHFPLLFDRYHSIFPEMMVFTKSR